MRRLPLIAAMATVLAAFSVGGGQGRALPPRSFAFAIGNGNLAGGPEQVAARLGGFDLVVVDGELARSDEVAALRADGVTVLGYLSVGTIERWRSWYPLVKQFRLGAWADWKDEWFADVSRAKLRRLLTRKIAPSLLEKGFDGLFLDNVDMVETGNHADQRDGMRALVQALAGLAHGDGRLLFAQNGAGILDRLGLVGMLDGWNREDVTWTYDFDRRRYVHQRPAETRAALSELSEMAAQGLITTSADYTREGDANARAEAVANACSVGALPYVGDIGLTARRLPDPPLTCP